jgi:hypothetical protein
MTTRVHRRCGGLTDHGLTFLYAVEGLPTIKARGEFEAGRHLLMLGLSGPVEFVTDTGTVLRRSTIEALAALTIEDGEKLRVRSWRPLDDKGGRAAHGEPRALTLIGHTAAADRSPVVSRPTCKSTSNDAPRLVVDADQWILIIAGRRYYCRLRIGLERWLGKDHPLLVGLPDWHHQLDELRQAAA